MDLIEKAMNIARSDLGKKARSSSSTSDYSADAPTLLSSDSVIELICRGDKTAVVPDNYVTGISGGPPELNVQRAQFNQQLRVLRRQVVEPSPGSSDTSANLILVTSAMPGDGKTFCALHLALSIAKRRDLKVTLVDADVIRCTLSATLGCSEWKGLNEFLADPEIQLDSVIYPTQIDRLSILPAGCPNNESAENLASYRVAVLIDAMKRAGPRHVFVFDSAPILAIVESMSIVQRVGKVLLVARSGVTSRSAMINAIQALDSVADVKIILNSFASKDMSDVNAYAAYYKEF